jgi:preprotein translocase subunit SecE
MNPIRPVVEYFRSSKAELEKVSWPSKQQTITYSTIVIVASVAAAAFFGLLDIGLGKGIQSILFRNTNTTQTQTQTTPTDLTFPQLTPTDIQATTPDGTPTTDVQVTPTPAPNPSTKTNP